MKIAAYQRKEHFKKYIEFKWKKQYWTKPNIIIMILPKRIPSQKI